MTPNATQRTASQAAVCNCLDRPNASIPGAPAAAAVPPSTSAAARPVAAPSLMR